ncbi:CBO0543 family protein [Gracilibacillus sp. D59]|uniref:CBO0543 family protein n=1 Tax=Gracilibacillus sp. D59 TaxID=3457434 RepID=UPI003FCE0FF7
MKNNYLESNFHIHEQLEELQKSKMSIWIEEVLFTPHWWILIILTFLPWILWFVFSKKESRNRSLFVGFIMMLISSFLDFIGVQFGLWLYNYELFPWIPAFAPWDFTLIPVIIMGLIQYKPHFSPTIKAFVFSFLSAFVGGNIFKYFDFYTNIHWSEYYSFPIYFLLYFIGHWASRLSNYAPYIKSQ